MLDIGSGKLVFLSGRKTSSGLYSISRLSTVDYGGFFDGEWLSPDTLAQDIASVMPQGVKRPQTLYVGVPCDFLQYRNNSVPYRFDGVRTVTRGDVDKLFARGNIYGSDRRRTVIATAACGFRLDANVFAVDPVGKQTETLDADVTYILCDNAFCSTISDAVREYGFREICFVSSFWAECSSLLDRFVRARGVIAVDAGYSATSVAYALGDGFDGFCAMPFGCATIAGELAETFSLDCDESVRLLDEINLGYGDDETYMLDTGDGVASFPSAAVHDVVRGGLDRLISVIKSLKDGSDADIYVTGGGLASVKGALAYIGGATNTNPRMFAPGVPMYSKPWLSSAFGTFDAAHRTESGNSPLGRLLDKIRR